MVDTGDTAWMLAATALVLLMTPALGLFYAGLVRSKNTLNTFMMCVGAIAVAAVTWAVVGYSIAFDGDGALFGGLGYAFLNDVTFEPREGTTIPHLLFMAFQATFCIITVALVSGAVVERMRFGAFLLFAGLWSILVYAVLAHWAFGDVVRSYGGVCRIQRATYSGPDAIFKVRLNKGHEKGSLPSRCGAAGRPRARPPPRVRTGSDLREQLSGFHRLAGRRDLRGQLPPGVYYLVIDSAGDQEGRCGAYKLTVTGVNPTPDLVLELTSSPDPVVAGQTPDLRPDRHQCGRPGGHGCPSHL